MATKLVTLDTVLQRLNAGATGVVDATPASLQASDFLVLSPNAVTPESVLTPSRLANQTISLSQLRDAALTAPAASFDAPNGIPLLDAAGKLKLTEVPSLPPSQLSGGDALAANPNIPVSPAPQFNAPNGIPLLDAAGKLPQAFLPAVGRAVVSWNYYPLGQSAGTGHYPPLPQTLTIRRTFSFTATSPTHIILASVSIRFSCDATARARNGFASASASASATFSCSGAFTFSRSVSLSVSASSYSGGNMAVIDTSSKEVNVSLIAVAAATNLVVGSVQSATLTISIQTNASGAVVFGGSHGNSLAVAKDLQYLVFEGV